MSSNSTVGGTDDGYHYAIDSDQLPTEAVIQAVADASDRTPMETIEDAPPLYESVDPDALDTLLASDRSTGLTSVRFAYDGYVVTVDNTGAVTVVET